MSVFNSHNKQELKMSLFHEIIMNFIIEKRCYNGGLEVIFFIICIKLD